MPMPPTSGVGAVRQRVSSGARSRFRAKRERRSAQIDSAAAGKAARAARVLTCGEGNRSLLGLCLRGRRVPTLGRDDDGLLRPPALPRALRQPLSAGLPGEIQGIAARDLLFPPQSARAPGRLPGRFRAALPEQEHPALSRLPPGPACLLDLLLRLAPARGTVA